MKHKQFIIMLTIMFGLVLSTTACEDYTVDDAGVSHSGDYEFRNICIDGVTYVTRKLDYRAGVMSVKFGRDSKVILCNNRDK